MTTPSGQAPSIGRTTSLAVLLVSAAAFLFQVALTRLFAIAHFYHFAFILIALALLGGGASGSFLALRPRLALSQPHRLASFWCAACGASILGAYLLTNRLPFDAYAVAIDSSQLLIVSIHFLALAAPFFCVGLLVSTLMRAAPARGHIVYAANLAGSALGCAAAPIMLPVAGAEGAVMLSTMLAALAALLAWAFAKQQQKVGSGRALFKPLHGALLAAICLGLIILPASELALRARGESGHTVLRAHISPYKPISYALQIPGAQVTSTRWNAFSQVDVVTSQGIRSLPGLSFLYTNAISAEAGIFTDGGDLTALLPPDPSAPFLDFLPQALAYQLRPNAHALILEARAGADILAALAGGAQSVTAVEPNPLIVDSAQSIYRLPGVRAAVESPRAFLAATSEKFDIIQFTLTSSFFPVTSGAYSLGEDYRYTRESFQSALERLKPGGLLVVGRWLQLPPSEFLRAFILAVEALEGLGLSPAERIAALRGYNLGMLFVTNKPFEADELEAIRAFAAQRAYDLVYLPGLQAEEANLFNILPEDVYYSTFTDYLTNAERRNFLRAYAYDVSAPTDNNPFYMHFFKWSQIAEVLQTYGTTWQPFGGAGFLVIIFLLALMIAFSLLLIVLPLAFSADLCAAAAGGITKRGTVLAYFSAIGVGFMAVEIPLIQKFILYLGQPTYAFSLVIAVLLLTSGLGSLASQRAPRGSLLALALLVLTSPLWLPAIFQASLGWAFGARLLVAISCLAPLGLLMGMPLAKGMAALGQQHARLIPWAWAVNGVTSVISSVLAALLALTFNFSVVLLLGCAAYLLAFILLGRLNREDTA